jgi:hypothetical protein
MPKPKFEYSTYLKNKPSTNAPQLELDRFWDKEQERWKIGYSGLTGAHYFFLTQCKIKNAEGAEIRPYWRDVDDFIFGKYQDAITLRKDILYAKRREVGLTTIFGGVVPIWSSLVNPGSNNLITSADKDRIKNLFIEKTSVVYDNLDPYIKPSRAGTRQDGFMFFAKKDTKTDEYTGLKSSIISKETVKKPSAFETYRAKSGFIDEFFLHPKASEVLASMQSCVKAGFKKIAPVVLGGSCGISSVEGLKAGMKLWADAEFISLITVFIPGWQGVSEAMQYDENGNETNNIINFCPNGYSDEKAATQWILQTREILGRAQDKTRYRRFVREYPLTIDELFSISGDGVFKEYPEIPKAIDVQKIYILNNPPPVMTYNLHRNHSNKVEAEANPEGKFVILEKSQLGISYIAGSDPIPFNTENIEQGSDYAIVIKKPLASTYVGYYKERNLDSDTVIKNCILLQDHFNQAKTLFEVNRGGVAKKTYKDLGRSDLLAKRPEALGIQFIDKNEAYGYYKTGHTAQRGVQLLINYLLKHTDKIFFREVLDELNQFLVGNTDLLDAIIACEFQDANIIELNKKYTPQTKRKQFAVWEMNSAGIRTQNWYWRYEDGRVEKC